MWCASCRIPPPSWAQACSASQEDPALPKDVFAMILGLFGLLGSTIVLPEKKFNAFMALVGCGPAYVFHFMTPSPRRRHHGLYPSGGA